MEKNDWKDLSTKKTQTKDGKNLLPREWTKILSKKISVVYPFCFIAFDRYLLPKKAEHLLTAPFYCTIAGCSIRGEIFLYPNMILVVKHKSNAITHARKSSKSFKSRKITGSQRDNLKRTLVDCHFPSREYHKKLDECSFNSGNLGEIGNSKNVYKQIKQEGLKAEQKHEKIFISLMNLKEEYLSQFDYDKIKGFIQYFSMQSFVIGLWTEKDIDMFHYNAKQYALMGDATGSIAAKVGTKMILCYSFVLCDKTRSSELLANIGILTDSHDELPIRHRLNQLILNEKIKFGHNSNTVPFLFTCDMSWPILKSAICCFNNESVEEYLSLSYRISNCRASSSDLHMKPSKLFLYFC